MAPLEVHLNRDGPHSIEVAPPVYETAGSFAVVFRNHGRALHVHCNLDDDLSAAARLRSTNHFVDEGSTARVQVDVTGDRLPVEGRLKVVTGYGAETEYVPVSITSPSESESTVRVDEQLSKPRPRPNRDPLVDPEYLPVIGLAALAVLIAAIAVVLVSDPVVILGVVVILGGIVAAATLLQK